MAAVNWNSPLNEAPGLYLPADVLEDAGLFPVTRLEDLSCTIEEGRIILEPLEDEDSDEDEVDETDEAIIRDDLCELLPVELCARMEDAGIPLCEIWDILERNGWFA